VGAVLGALVLVQAGCAARSRAGNEYPELMEYSGREIDEVVYQGGAPFSSDTLLTMTETQPSQCSLLGLPLCLPFTSIGHQLHRVNVGTIAADVDRLELFYRTSGFFGTRVIPEIEPKEDKVRVTFTVQRGDSIMLDSLEVVGTEGILDPDSMKQRLPLREGEIFHLGRLAASANRVLQGLQQRGHAYAEVLRNYGVDTVRDRAVATLEAVPGPQVRVDSIAIYGAEHLGRRTVLRGLTFREGDLLQASRLSESQDNLYTLDIVQLASVSLASDSLDATPEDSTRATVIVRIVEKRVNQLDAAIGYGTVECLRTETEYVNRSFGGGARRLGLNAAVSKIGLGGGTNTGIGQSLCRAFDRDTFEDNLDYRLAAELTQPYFLSPRNYLTVNGYLERQSEPDVFQREAQGGRFTLSRRITNRSVLNSSLNVEHGRTLATPALFCLALQVCEPATIDSLSRPRFRNSLGLSYVRDHTNNPLDPSAGGILRGGLTWAPQWIGSEVTFLRFTGENAIYRQVRPGWTFAGAVRLGTFFRTAGLTADGDFLPPEERFYAGGATTVRGFDRNRLGGGVYVTQELVVDTVTGQETAPDGAADFVPVGGTSLFILNAELRFPSPWYPRRFRLAAFVDAGSIGTGNFFNIGEGLKVTPGLGLRVNTPVGPARVDVAYNPYGLPKGPLYFSNGETLVLVQDDFRPPTGGFFSRLRVHVALGQAF